MLRSLYSCVLEQRLVQANRYLTDEVNGFSQEEGKGDREMAYQLRVHPALPVNWGSGPSTHIVGLQPPSSCLNGKCKHVVSRNSHTHTYTQK